MKRRREDKDGRFNTGKGAVKRGRVDKDGRFVWMGWSKKRRPEQPGEYIQCPSCGRPQPANKSLRRHLHHYERIRCSPCDVYVTRTNMNRHTRRIHSESEEAKRLVKQKVRSQGVERKRQRGRKRDGDDSEECKECGKLVTGKNMARHLHRFHVNSEAEKEALARAGCRRESVKGRWGEVESPGERSGDEDGEEEDDVDDDGAATEGEEETGGESSQEEEKGVKRTTSKKKRLSETRCQLCRYRGTDERMTSHILMTHIIPPNEP